MIDHNLNNLDNFIGAWYLENTKICDDIINYHSLNPNKKEGKDCGIVNKNIKDSLDCVLTGDLLDQYIAQLQLCVDRYIEKYPHCALGTPWSIIEPVNIQYYKPGGGYHAWHSERLVPVYPFVSRHLVFMTYLNTVSDAGETEFYHQKVKIKPEKGLTVIWPADWTFYHRGITSRSQEKYIITGWFNYILPNS